MEMHLPPPDISPAYDDYGYDVEEYGEIAEVEEIEEEGKKDYERKSEEPMYNVEERIDQLIKGKNLTLRERWEHKFGDKFDVPESVRKTRYKKTDQEELPFVQRRKVVPELEETGKEEENGEEEDDVALSPDDIVKKWAGDAKEEELPEKDAGLDEFTRFKRLVDSLLDNLPENIVKKFMESKGFDLYKRVMKSDEPPKTDRMEFITLSDKLLGKLPEETIVGFKNDKESFDLYRRVVTEGA